MKKTTLLLSFVLSLIIVSCKPEPEPEPNGGGQGTDTTETMVKKYLVREYYADFPEESLKEIEWNDDHSRITHITTYKNNPYQLDFSFEYFGSDSMRVVLSKPADSWAILLYSSYTCIFDESGRIDHVDFYVNSEYQSTQVFLYDAQGRLVGLSDEQQQVIGPRFVWEGDNVCGIYNSNGELLYDYYGFTEQYHPYSTLPYLLFSGDGYHSLILTEPLWKNWYTKNSEGGRYEYDEDGYVTYTYFVTPEGEINSRICYDYSE